MSLVTKIVAGTLFGAGAIAGWSYIKTLKTASAELEIQPIVNIHKLGWDGLTLRLDLKLKNPSKGSFSIRFPYVKLLYKESLIGSSNVVDKEIKIPAFGEVVIDKIMIQIPMTNVFSIAFALIKALTGGDSAILTIRTITTINLGIIKLPFEDKQNITIKK